MTPLKAEITYKKIPSLLLHKGSPLLVLALAQDTKDKKKIISSAQIKKQKELNSLLKSVETLERFEAKAGEGLALYQSQALKAATSHKDLFLFGLGSLNAPSAQDMLILGAKLAQELKKNKITSADISLDSLVFTPNAAAEDFAGRKEASGKLTSQDIIEKLLLGFHLALYSFDEYKTSPKADKKTSSIRLQLLGSSLSESEAKQLLSRVQILAESVYASRDLMNLPGNDLAPADLAKKAQELGKKSGFQTSIWDEKKLAQEKMNGILTVGKGSERPPRLIIMQHNASKKGVPTLVLVGKGITFDTGGISLKPGAGMEAMKMDMGGSATVLGAMYGIAKSKAPIRVIGIVPAAENMPDGKAARPGDIYAARGGKTVEVLNTDAEGRLVLADALEYAKTLKPTAVVDVATLTGAVVIALGGACVGVMGNNAKLLDGFKKAASQEGERAWELPLYPEYSEDMKSKIADLQNIGTSRSAGSSKGGAFLNAFVENAYPWIHVDMAGVMDASKEQGAHCPGGPSGVPTRSLIELALNFKKYF